MPFFTDDHRTDLEDYDFCGDDWMEESFIDTEEEYVVEAFSSSPKYTLTCPRCHAKVVEYAYFKDWAILRLKEAFAVRTATAPELLVFPPF